ncbi:MAG: type I-D CRISPR-associated endonuclease Cas1 [Chloroflexi bacterium]|nr:type I-D CRISPR-associated endonuclease Cas1 [Chloroflexota bacterium]
MSTLYLTEQLSVVKKDGETLVVHIPGNADKGIEKRAVRVPLIKVDQVVVHGDVTLTAPALQMLMQQRIEVCFTDYFGRFVGRLTPEFSKNSLVRLAQHRTHNDPPRALDLAKKFVAGKLSNGRTMLLRANRKLGDAEMEKAIGALKNVLDKVDASTVENALGTRAQATELNPAVGVVNDLLGLEGAGSAMYFGVFGKLLKGAPNGEGWNFVGRAKRPPTDPINALLSYGYTILMHKVQAAIGIVGLDPFVGYLHSSQYGKPALALDLMEEFRPVIVDSVVITVINNGVLQANDFMAEAGTFRMTDAARRRFLEKFEERMQTEIEHPTFHYKATYQRCIELQVRLLAKTLTGEIGAYPPFLVR